MNITKQSIRGSPHVGVLAIATERFALIPKGTHPKEQKSVEESLRVECVPASVAGSPLIGSMAKALEDKIVVPEIVERSEVNSMERAGLKVKTVSGVPALGNLIALNQQGILFSPSLEKKKQSEIAKFFGLSAESFRVAGSDLVGAAVSCTNQGFIAHPRAAQKEFNALKKLFGVNGKATSANYGDAFVGNSVLANSRGAVVGLHTTSSELLRIDEGLGG